MSILSSAKKPVVVCYDNRKYLYLAVAIIGIAMALALIAGKTYQHWDNDPDRGAIAVDTAKFGDNYTSPPIYNVDQGWDAADSLWFYYTTDGSNLIPYDFFLALEKAESAEPFRSIENIDHFRFLPQKATFFNPDGLPVGFAKDTYQGRDYVGFTCAACHTGQINYEGKAIRIDGGPSMANLEGFLDSMEKAMRTTLLCHDGQTPECQRKWSQFVTNVLAMDNDYESEQDVLDGLTQWTKTIALYNTINANNTPYGYARLDAFGRIYNRVLQHVLNKPQLRSALVVATCSDGEQILTEEQVLTLLADVGETIMVGKQFPVILDRLIPFARGNCSDGESKLTRLRDHIFNEPNAPVSYPILWDVAQSDYVEWNGLANNAGLGALGRNAGQVIGVFGNLDWTAKKPGLNLSYVAAKVTGQSKKNEQIDFTSSINLVNLQRLESHLRGLQSPKWPTDILGDFDMAKVNEGQILYARYCESCHEVILRDNWDRVAVAKMIDIKLIGTDPTMAENSVNYRGLSGNFKHTVQATGVGDVYIAEKAPVIEILKSATKGVIATPDPDKWLIRRGLDRIYTLAMSFFNNHIRATIKRGSYQIDTTANPYNSLLAYKARPLNGIWATAPYLHNGSVPTLYDLLLPTKSAGKGNTKVDCPSIGAEKERQYRPNRFVVGSREFDRINVGLRCSGYDGFEFDTSIKGNYNTGHEYGARDMKLVEGQYVPINAGSGDKVDLPALKPEQRLALLEFLKTL